MPSASVPFRASLARRFLATLIEPPACYTDFIDPAFRDTAPRLVRNNVGGDMYQVHGMETLIPLGTVTAAGKDPRKIRMAEEPFEALHRGGWDPAQRLADQPREHVRREARRVAERLVVRAQRVGQGGEERGLVEHLDVDRDAEPLRDGARVRRLVEARVVEADRERAHRPVARVRDRGEHERRVDAARQERGDRHVALEVLLAGARDERCDQIRRLVERARAIRKQEFRGLSEFDQRF